jgi:hypothetical protein
MHLHSTLDADLFILDVEHIYDDIMHYDAFFGRLIVLIDVNPSHGF